MKIKSHSLMLGYREYTARVGRGPDGRALLMVDDIGPLPALDYIKHGFKIVEASEREIGLLRQAEYPIRPGG